MINDIGLKDLDMFDTGNENAIPFWGANSKLAGGRDPLAIQNSSVIIYTSMIPGITNLTSRVRYMGFYCWLLNRLLKELERKGETKLSKKNQISHLRRSELLLAYITYANYQSIDSSLATGVGGTQYAGKHFEKFCAGVNLKKGEKAYWKNSLGIFGQYYVGVMLSLGLIANPDDEHSWYRCTSIGDSLGEAFEGNVTESVGDRFIESIMNGYVDRKDLSGDFKAFALHVIPESEELSLYRKIILGKDSEFVQLPTYYRRDTIKLILKYIDSGAKTSHYRTISKFVEPFLQDNFEDVLNSELEVSEEKKFWFLYELNELVHFSYEIFHTSLLKYLTQEPQSFDSVMSKLLTVVEEECDERKEKVVSDLDDKSSIYEIFSKLCSKKDDTPKIYYAIKLLLALHTNVKKHLDILKIQKIGGETVYREGSAPILLPMLIANKEDMKITEVATDILVKAINIHTKSSFEKSTIAKGLVNNYLIDDGFIWKLKDTYATRTNPRIKNTLQYLVDMQLVSVTPKYDYLQLTEEGRKFLREE